MTINAIKCPKCRQPLPDNLINAGINSCRACGKQVSITVFPALFKKQEEHAPNANHSDDDASSCFYHENLNASVHCEVCGRFLCDLCRVDMNGKDICPGCIMAHRESDKVGDLEKRRPLHCRSAILAAVIGFFMPFFFVGQVVAIIYGIRSLMQKAPTYSRAIDEKLTGILALVFALTGTLLGLLFWGNIFFD